MVAESKKSIPSADTHLSGPNSAISPAEPPSIESNDTQIVQPIKSIDSKLPKVEEKLSINSSTVQTVADNEQHTRSADEEDNLKKPLIPLFYFPFGKSCLSPTDIQSQLDNIKVELNKLISKSDNASLGQSGDSGVKLDVIPYSNFGQVAKVSFEF